MTLNLNEFQKNPTLTATGEKWVQNCMYCNKQINFFKISKESIIYVGPYVRHRKCYPPPAK